MKKDYGFSTLGLGLGLVVVLLDQLTKIWAEKTLATSSITLIPNFFSLRLVYNSGAAWSILSGKMTFFYVVTMIALVGFGYEYYRTKKTEKWYRFGLILILAGALGNFIDRLLYQQVRDFLDFILFGYDYPVFNVADISLCVGVGMVVIYYLFMVREK